MENSVDYSKVIAIVNNLIDVFNEDTGFGDDWYRKALNEAKTQGCSMEEILCMFDELNSECSRKPHRVAKFEFVSDEEFSKYESAGGVCVRKLPERATVGSAGYDFFSPYRYEIPKGGSLVIPTGIRCCMLTNYVLSLYPRSGMGFKYGVRVANTVGIIDSDYYYSTSNEGHIMVKLVNGGEKDIVIEAGDAFCQGIFTEYFITIDDSAEGIRDGGFGSTSK